eukprot:m.39448 g.39448  ORF g.39448 m.39448 type:complete len:230 (+) comp9554_c0_seq2:211-900(+)
MSAEKKYPSTPHLPFSPCVQSDDILMDISAVAKSFTGKEVVITEKLDGGNCCVKDGKVFARTHSKEATHASFSTIKHLFAGLSGLITSNLELFGENMTAIHSIRYDRLDSYFYLFAVRNFETGQWLSWSEVESLATELGIPTVPVLFSGVLESAEDLPHWMEEWAKQPSKVGSNTPEGFVIRPVGEFPTENFDRVVAKYVRPNHIQTTPNWKGTWQKATLNGAFQHDAK